MIDCKTCKHATVIFTRDKEDRFSTSYTPLGFVRCSGPRYRGRLFFLRDNRAACKDYERLERSKT
jgi:hypothetical protein